MSERTYTTVDKTTWPRGEWDNEPDKIQWVDEATGLDCLIHRHPRLGHLCGYVGVPSSHPLHGLDYNDAYDVLRPTGDDEWPNTGHGDITYAAACQDTDDESKGICHVPEPGRPHDVWWFGFDCAHSGDLSPNSGYIGGFEYERYRDVPYVKRCTAEFAQTLAAVNG